MDRRSYLKNSLALGGALLVPTGVLALVGCSRTGTSPDLSGFNGRIMGTGYSVRLGNSTATAVHDRTVTESETRALAQAVHTVLEDVDTHMSTWRSDSELSRLNDSADTDWQPLSEATARVIDQALTTGRASDGAFDVTIGPLVDLWGFGAGAETSGDRKPSTQAIRQRLAQVGHGAIEVNTSARVVRKHNRDAQLDLSGIAKGHAVDRVAELLDSRGYENYLVEVGGELRARGQKPNGSLWKVAIERPIAGRREAYRAIDLNNHAIATSGDYRNFFADGGQRYSHSIDPRTGQPVQHNLASVSVVADSTMAADALSTAMMVMGPDDAMAFAKQHNVAAHLILKSGTSLKEVYSPAFETLLSSTV
jgi:thiamine biosynthesis lipoprotein